MEKKHNIQPMSVLPNQLISLFTHTRFFVIFSGFSRSKRKVHYSITLLPWLMKTWRLNILYVAVHFTQLCTLPIIVSQWVYAALGPKSEDLRFLYSMSEKLLCVCVCVFISTSNTILSHTYRSCAAGPLISTLHLDFLKNTKCKGYFDMIWGKTHTSII